MSCLQHALQLEKDLFLLLGMKSLEFLLPDGFFLLRSSDQMVMGMVPHLGGQCVHHGDKEDERKGANMHIAIITSLRYLAVTSYIRQRVNFIKRYGDNISPK